MYLTVYIVYEKIICFHKETVIVLSTEDGHIKVRNVVNTFVLSTIFIDS